MNYYVIGILRGDQEADILSLGADGVIAFESWIAAEDFIDMIDEPGEFRVLKYDETMGPAVIAA